MTNTKLARRRAPRGEGDKLRDEVLDAAEKLLIASGDADAVSIRAIAEAVGVTPPSIYLHFADKQELINAVCERHFRELDRVSAAAIEGIDDPVLALKSMGKAYVRFGLDRPEQYRILFMSRELDPNPRTYLERLKGLSGFNHLVEAVRRCVEAGVFRPGDPFVMACTLWAGVHGITSLLIAKPNFPWPKKFAQQGIDALCGGLTKP